MTTTIDLAFAYCQDCGKQYRWHGSLILEPSDVIPNVYFVKGSLRDRCATHHTNRFKTRIKGDHFRFDIYLGEVRGGKSHRTDILLGVLTAASQTDHIIHINRMRLEQLVGAN